MSEQEINNEHLSIKKHKTETISLTANSSQKITSWLDQISQKKKGVKITRKDFINWLIDKSPDNLNSSDLSALIERFYDEAAFLRQLLRDVKQAKSEGKSETGFELVLKTKKSDQKREPNDNVETTG